MADKTYLIAGLGNPGVQYEWTRHNIGFEICNVLAERLEADWHDKRYAFCADAKLKGRRIFLIKPTTYMNLSGRAILHWMNQLKITNEQLLVVTDDINLQPGQIRIKPKGSDGGHNGLRNIQEMMGTNQYPRLRFGVGNDFHPGQQVNYVLEKWDAYREKEMKERIELAADGVAGFALEGVERAMNRFNGM
jgi:PTH1 family peptidyl-tRNA hydrolase